MTGRGESRQKNSLFQDILITATGLIPVAFFSAFRTASQFRILSPRHTGLRHNNARSRAVSHTPLLVRDFCYCANRCDSVRASAALHFALRTVTSGATSNNTLFPCFCDHPALVAPATTENQGTFLQSTTASNCFLQTCV